MSEIHKQYTYRTLANRKPSSNAKKCPYHLDEAAAAEEPRRCPATNPFVDGVSPLLGAIVLVNKWNGSLRPVGVVTPVLPLGDSGIGGSGNCAN